MFFGNISKSFRNTSKIFTDPYSTFWGISFESCLSSNEIYNSKNKNLKNWNLFFFHVSLTTLKKIKNNFEVVWWASCNIKIKFFFLQNIPKISFYFFKIYKKFTLKELAELNRKKNQIFIFRVMVISVKSSLNFQWNFAITQKIKIGEFFIIFPIQ